MKVIRKGSVGSKYHFSGDKYYTIKKFIKTVLKIKNYTWSKLVRQSPERKGKDKNYYLNCKKTKLELGWRCKTTLDLGIKKTIHYYDTIMNDVDAGVGENCEIYVIHDWAVNVICVCCTPLGLLHEVLLLS